MAARLTDEQIAARVARENGTPCGCAHEPVRTRLPSASTTSRPTTESAAVRCSAAPWNTLFCDSAPPTVAKRPDSGPQYGVRSPFAASAASSASHVTPASATTYMSRSWISMRSSRRRSRSSAPSCAGV